MIILIRTKLCKHSVQLITVLLLCHFPVQLLASEKLMLSFGLYASDKPTTLVKKFRPILNQLEKDLSSSMKKEVSIKISIAKTYQAGIDNLVKGKVDFVRFGPASYIIAKQKNNDIRLLAMETKKGKKHFNGVIVTHNASKIHNISDLKQKRFAFGSERSTIGRYLSQQYLLTHGISAKNLARYEYLGRHDNVGYAVAIRKYDAGALKESTFKKLVKKGQPLRVIGKFRNVTKPWVARSDLDKKTLVMLKAALLQLKDKQILANIKKDGFVSATHNDYTNIEKAIRRNSTFFKQ